MRKPNLLYDPLIVCKQANEIECKLCPIKTLNFYVKHFFDIGNIDIFYLCVF